MATCDFSGLESTACDHCRRGGRPPRLTPPPLTGRWLEARYPGQCRSCGEPYRPGTQITASETGGWIAECCAGEEDA